MLSSDASQAMVNRVSGFLDYWAKYAPTKWEITKDIALNGGDVKKAESDAAKLLKKNENIKGIYGCNNTSTVGIAKTLTKQKRTDIVMVGFDMAEETKQFIKDSGSFLNAKTRPDGISGNRDFEFPYQWKKIRAKIF